jgi:23S rRNA (uracil1939-C5)-methyltransferase
MKVRDRVRVTLEDIALGGKALARVDGKVVFVDRGLPGDEVTVQITKTNRRFAEARLVTVEQPSPARQAARCAHVDQCGGCRFQELPYEAQAALKERQVREALQHLGGIADPPVRPIVPAPAAWHYRNKMEYSFMPRPETAADGTVTEVPVLGMHERGRFDRVFELRECLLPSPLTLEIVRFTQAFARTHGWRADHPTRHDGVARSLVVRHLPHTASCAVHLIAASDALPGLAEWARGIAALSPEVRTVTLGLNRSLAGVAFSEEERPLVGDGVIVERLLGLTFEVVGNAFLQTTVAIRPSASTRARSPPPRCSRTRPCSTSTAGAGTLTLLFARVAREVIGVENVADSIERATRNVTRNGDR